MPIYEEELIQATSTIPVDLGPLGSMDITYLPDRYTDAMEREMADRDRARTLRSAEIQQARQQGDVDRLRELIDEEREQDSSDLDTVVDRLATMVIWWDFYRTKADYEAKNSVPVTRAELQARGLKVLMGIYRAIVQDLSPDPTAGRRSGNGRSATPTRILPPVLSSSRSVDGPESP